MSKDKNRCPYFKKCGSCEYMDINYEEQLQIKEKRVKDLVGGMGPVKPIIGMKDPYHYRNKVHATFKHMKSGDIIAGTYEAGTHNVVPIKNCLIENEKADEIIQTLCQLFKSFKMKTYNEDSGYGTFRHVLIRNGFHSGEIMVVLVLGNPIFPSKNNFIKALREKHPEITTIIMNLNSKPTSMILGDRETVLFGKGYIEDVLCDLRFKISPKSFYQVNPAQTEILYKKAMELAELTGTEKVIDAYCGVGTIGLIASRHAKEVMGVELNRDAVKDAIVNAKMNEIKNVRFYNQDAGEFMVQLAAQGEHVDVVFMDPPRFGSDEKFLTSLVTLKPKKVVYISCGPESLERDLKFLKKNGYKIKEIQPVDMFGWTVHVETVVLLSHKNS